MKFSKRAAILLASLSLIPAISAGISAAHAGELKIGLAEDPDALDPAQGRTLVGRIVMNSLCDKLVDITTDLQYTPQLATSWKWSDDNLSLVLELRHDAVFHDGTPVNAAAVVANIERSKTLKESLRKSELTSVSKVEATGEFQVTFTLSKPDVTLLAQLTDRAGMMVSPAAAEKLGANFGSAPVCSGPFEFVQRVAQDRIVLKKFPKYWNAKNILLDGVTFLPIPDGTVRLTNVRSGDLDIIERLAPTDVESVKSDPKLSFAEVVGLGYQSLDVNTNFGAASKTPFGQDSRLRRAFSISIDRDALNQVVLAGTVVPGNQPFPPSSPWYNQAFPVPKRDIAAAKALMAEAGVDRVQVEMMSSNDPVTMQTAQMLQSMVAEAGFDLKISTMEYGTQLSEQQAGNYQIELGQTGWSGRADPDGNLHAFVTCAGSLNDGKYCNKEVDALLNDARTISDPAARKVKYDAALAILQTDMPGIYLYHNSWMYALDAGVKGFVPYPDGIIRLPGVSNN